MKNVIKMFFCILHSEKGAMFGLGARIALAGGPGGSRARAERLKRGTPGCKAKTAFFAEAVKKIDGQKGAMFGLDARIALAIFGGLSVIAGMSIFGAIREAQITSLSTELDNISKGYQEYVVGTGTDTSTIGNMWNPAGTPTGWDGPYLTVTSPNHIKYGTMALASGRQDTNAAPPDACAAGNLCAMWLHLTGVTDSIAAQVDTKIDGAAGATSGRLRIQVQAGATDDIYYRLARCQLDSCV